MTYVNVAFFQGEAGERWTEDFEEMDSQEFIDAVLEHADPYGETVFDESKEKPWGAMDQLYTMNYDGKRWFVSVNYPLGYIGVCHKA